MRATKLEFTGKPMVLRSEDGTATVTIPIRIKRYSGRQEVVVPQGIAVQLNEEQPLTTMQVALARGHRWLRQIESGQVTNITEIAKREKLDRSYISRMINLTTLAPDIQAAILNETLPDHVSLFDLATNTPLCWAEQRARLSGSSSKSDTITTALC